MNIVMVPVLEEHLDDLRAISRTTFKDTFDAITPEEDMQKFLDEAYNIEKLSGELNNPNSYFYFMKVNDEVASYLKVNINDAQSEKMSDEYLEIERIYVLPQFKRMGLGKLMYNRAIEIAHEQDKTKIWLGVWEDNENAQAFYRSLGFEQTGEHVFMVGDDRQVDIIMEKRV